MQVIIQKLFNGKVTSERPMSQAAAHRMVLTNPGKFQIKEGGGVEKVQIVEKKKVVVKPVEDEKTEAVPVEVKEEEIPEPPLVEKFVKAVGAKPKTNKPAKAKKSTKKSKPNK